MENVPFIDGLPIKNGDFIITYLVGGWPIPLKNMKVSWDDSSQYMEK